ncbi:hypothetical protein FRB99_005654 [Tulasnella sp. 403]|nr:hypothetical protein FRB99_005654 [Tulasnella sp. 403]
MRFYVPLVITAFIGAATAVPLSISSTPSVPGTLIKKSDPTIARRIYNSDDDSDWSDYDDTDYGLLSASDVTQHEKLWEESADPDFWVQTLDTAVSEIRKTGGALSEGQEEIDRTIAVFVGTVNAAAEAFNIRVMDPNRETAPLFLRRFNLEMRAQGGNDWYTSPQMTRIRKAMVEMGFAVEQYGGDLRLSQSM